MHENKITSDDNLLNMYNVIILIKSVLNKNHNHYYYLTFLEKCSNEQYIKYAL